jgi:hypothetical protein
VSRFDAVPKVIKNLDPSERATLAARLIADLDFEDLTRQRSRVLADDSGAHS